MFQILQEAGIAYKDRRLIYNLYKYQTSIIEVDNEQRNIKVQKGVRQGCILSPIIFNLYAEEAVRKVKNMINGGINFQGEKVNMLRFADDIAIITASKQEPEEAIIEMETVFKKDYGMKVNRAKTRTSMRWKKK